MSLSVAGLCRTCRQLFLTTWPHAPNVLSLLVFSDIWCNMTLPYESCVGISGNVVGVFSHAFMQA